MFKKLISTIFVSTIMLYANEVNVYSSRHYDSDKELYKMFEKQTGIKVNVIEAKDDALIKRLESEGAKSPADVFITVDAARIQRAMDKNLFQPIKSKLLEDTIPEKLRDKNNNWFGLTKRARVLAVTKDSPILKDLPTYEDLANPKYKDQLMVRSSTSVYNQSLMSAMIIHHGEEFAINWAKGIVDNLARDPKGGDRDQAKAVAVGLGSVAILNTYYFGALTKGDESDKEALSKLTLYFPKFKNGGTHINISAGGVTKYAKNKENGIKFIEFLLSKEAQEVFAKGNFEYPVSKDAKVADVVKSWGTLEEDNISINELGKYTTQAVKALDVAGWK